MRLCVQVSCLQSVRDERRGDIAVGRWLGRKGTLGKLVQFMWSDCDDVGCLEMQLRTEYDVDTDYIGVPATATRNRPRFDCTQCALTHGRHDLSCLPSPCVVSGYCGGTHGCKIFDPTFPQHCLTIAWVAGWPPAVPR